MEKVRFELWRTQREKERMVGGRREGRKENELRQSVGDFWGLDRRRREEKKKEREKR